MTHTRTSCSYCTYGDAPTNVIFKDCSAVLVFYHHINLESRCTLQLVSVMMKGIWQEAASSLPEHIQGIYMCTLSAEVMENCRIVTFQNTQKEKVLDHQVQFYVFQKGIRACSKNGWTDLFCVIVWKVNIQDDCLEVGMGQHVYVTLQTWPQFCDVAYSKAYHVPGMGKGGVSDCTIQKTKEFPFTWIKCHDTKFSNTLDVFVSRLKWLIFNLSKQNVLFIL